MKSFDPDFRLRARFQLRYSDIIDVRASKLIPYLSLHDPCYIEIAGAVSWPSDRALSQSEEESEDTLNSRCLKPRSTDSPATSTISPQASSETCSTEASSSTNSSFSGKRQRADDEESVLKRCRLVPIRQAVHSSSEAGQNEQPGIAASSWAKSVIIRLQSSPGQVVQDLLYTFVKLPAPDVDQCVAAICTKMEIPFVKGMSVSWVDSKTLLRGPFDHAFLRSIPDMQDFVISITRMGADGNTGLLLEM